MQTNRKLDQLVWEEGRVTVDGQQFLLENSGHACAASSEVTFNLYKGRCQIGYYERFFRMLPDTPLRNIFELGIWDGGSAAFWFASLAPDKHVAVDLMAEKKVPSLEKFLASRNATDRLKLFWGVNQADGARLLEIYRREFTGPLDLVLDDASHLYGPTKASFETLFPLLRPGGVYTIEDWPWSYDKGYHAPDHAWAKEKPLADFILELVDLVGSSIGLIANISINKCFAAIERGASPLPKDKPFTVSQYITRRPARIDPQP